MNYNKAIQLYNELKTGCPGLLLAGSVLREKQEDIHDLDLIWVGGIFPIHLLPVKDIDTGSVMVMGKDILRFKYKGEQVDIYRTTQECLGAMILHLTGPKEYSIHTRTVAKKKGYKLNQYGLFKKNQCVASKTEKEILDKIGLKFLTPVERAKFKSVKI